jgi:hypothetical protein
LFLRDFSALLAAIIAAASKAMPVAIAVPAASLGVEYLTPSVGFDIIPPNSLLNRCCEISTFIISQHGFNR